MRLLYQSIALIYFLLIIYEHDYLNVIIKKRLFQVRKRGVHIAYEDDNHEKNGKTERTNRKNRLMSK